MATGTINLPILGFLGDATNPPGLTIGTDRPKLLFDDTTDESCVIAFRMPVNYASAPVLKIQFSMASDHDDSHKVEFEGSIYAITPTDVQDVDGDSYDTVNRGNSTIHDGLGSMNEVSITMTNADGLAAGDYVGLKVSRDSDGTGGNDDATGDCEVWATSLEYTTT